MYVHRNVNVPPESRAFVPESRGACLQRLLALSSLTIGLVLIISRQAGVAPQFCIVVLCIAPSYPRVVLSARFLSPAISLYLVLLHSCICKSALALECMLLVSIDRVHRLTNENRSLM